MSLEFPPLSQDESSESEDDMEMAKFFPRRVSISKDIRWETFLKEGILYKQSYSFQRWNKRYFKVKKGVLYYSKNNKDLILNQITLDEATIAECSLNNINHSFQVITPHRSLVLCSETRKEMKDWIGVMRSAATKDLKEQSPEITDKHNWCILPSIRPLFCNVCGESLQKVHISGVSINGLACEVCKIRTHKKCASRAPPSCKWTTLASIGSAVTEDKEGNVIMPHQWVEGNFAVNSKCLVCDKSSGSILKLQDFQCLWCQNTVHQSCKDFSTTCDLGSAHISILPPTHLTTYDEGGFWRATKPHNSSPLLVFVNSKSGDNQGVKMLRKFKQLLNPGQVFDLMTGGPIKGLKLFQNFECFRVLVCGGDGSVGWVLNEIDRLGLHRQCQLGILPLGTGNDLSRVMGWGATFDDDSVLANLLERLEIAQIRMFDRWSIMSYEVDNLQNRIIPLDPICAYEDSAVNHISRIVYSDSHNVVITSAMVLCGIVQELVSKLVTSADESPSHSLQYLATITSDSTFISTSSTNVFSSHSFSSSSSSSSSSLSEINNCFVSVTSSQHTNTTCFSPPTSAQTTTAFQSENISTLTNKNKKNLKLNELENIINEDEEFEVGGDDLVKKCLILRDKMEALLKTLAQESLAATQFSKSSKSENDIFPIITETTTDTTTYFTKPKPLTVLSSSSISRKNLMRSKEQLMVRANSLKKAIRNIVELTEKTVDEQNNQTNKFEVENQESWFLKNRKKESNLKSVQLENVNSNKISPKANKPSLTITIDLLEEKTKSNLKNENHSNFHRTPSPRSEASFHFDYQLCPLTPLSPVTPPKTPTSLHTSNQPSPTFSSSPSNLKTLETFNYPSPILKIDEHIDPSDQITQEPAEFLNIFSHKASLSPKVFLKNRYLYKKNYQNPHHYYSSSEDGEGLISESSSLGRISPGSQLHLPYHHSPLLHHSLPHKISQKHESSSPERVSPTAHLHPHHHQPPLLHHPLPPKISQDYNLNMVNRWSPVFGMSVNSPFAVPLSSDIPQANMENINQLNHGKDSETSLNSFSEKVKEKKKENEESESKLISSAQNSIISENNNILSPNSTFKLQNSSFSKTTEIKKTEIIFPLLNTPLLESLPNKRRKSSPIHHSLIHKVLLTSATAVCAPLSSLNEHKNVKTCDFSEKCVMNNYFGIGLDAKIALDFHNKREEHPHKYRSRTKNMMWYGVLGGREVLQRTHKNLDQRVRLECDGKNIPLPNLQGIVVLNILSYMGGINFWGRHKEDDNFLAPSFDDKILEVVAVFGSIQLGISRVINLQRHRIAQCRSVKITILGKESIPVQVDGEAWLQHPGVIWIHHKNRSQMLIRDRNFEEVLKLWKRVALHKKNNTNSAFVLEWSSSDVAKWLESQELEEYVDLFLKHDIRGSELINLKRQDLKDLGILKIGHIKRLLRETKFLREISKQSTSTSSSSVSPKPSIPTLELTPPDQLSSKVVEKSTSKNENDILCQSSPFFIKDSFQSTSHFYSNPHLSTSPSHNDPKTLHYRFLPAFSRLQGCSET